MSIVFDCQRKRQVNVSRNATMFLVLSKKILIVELHEVTMNEVELNLEATMQGRQVRFHRELCLPKEKYLKIKINNFLDERG